MNIIMLTPMNHREIEYNVKKFWVSEKIMEKNIADIFCVWNNETEKNAAINPKMLSFDKKRDDKKESAIRQKDWKTFIASLPSAETKAQLL